eukprot:gnl/TRDRNA2_/TRDRNA2_176055_c0_seq1.p1 gnl/TRDRNA2_/TRDRNA2_176055_c0~~gnl/TRDRNA2_/TRDRNA2_176055_c0_seq1.p1  ORF type:complete len:200 (-),score=33.20 gnl/TRDRNA2_/TRDRNA2_176055_c0_seq1:25-624(-)
MRWSVLRSLAEMSVTQIEGLIDLFETHAANSALASAKEEEASTVAIEAGSTTLSATDRPIEEAVTVVPCGDNPSSTAAVNATCGSTDTRVRLWVSGLPTDASKFVYGPEVQEVLNQALREFAPHSTGEVLEVDRKDPRKPFVFAMLSDESAGKELVKMSKKKILMLRGEPLILDLSNHNNAPVRYLYNGGASSRRKSVK